jgi:hypothetical protein
MDTTPIAFPHAREPSAEDRDRAIAEIDAAIELVLSRMAVRVRLTGIAFADLVAGPAAAHAQEAHVGFRIERDRPTGPTTVTVGPLD